MEHTARIARLEFSGDNARRVETLYLSPDMVAQRQAILEMLGLSRGERVVDIGTGPGLLAEEMARRVGEGGAVLGVDSSDAMIEIAANRCRQLSQVRFEIADATSLPCEAATFDVAVSSQVLEYVPDVTVALDQLARVLRPGGRAIVVDTDWASCVWACADEARMRRVLDAWDTHCPHPRLPRVLAGLMRNAGFVDVAVSVLPMLNVGTDVDTYSAGMAGAIARFVTKTGLVSPEEVAEWRVDLTDHADAGRYFFSLNRYVFTARRP
jgi:SAM-dependent methyltransferase